MASYTKDRDSALQQAQQAMNPQRNPQSELPPDIFSLLLQDQLGRDVLGRLGNPRDWNLPPLSVDEHGAAPHSACQGREL